MFVLVDHLALDATTMNGLAWLDAKRQAQAERSTEEASRHLGGVRKHDLRDHGAPTGTKRDRAVGFVSERCSVWEHAFVTAQGSALTRYRRALERRHIFGAEIAAREMAFLSLRDALGLISLYAAEDSPKFDKAAVRWLGRLALESDDLSLHDLQLAAAALHALPRRPDSAVQVLTDLSR